MPVLTADKTPPLSFDGARRTSRLPSLKSDKPWRVACCRSNCERSLASDLIPLKIPYFLPMQPQMRRGQGDQQSGFQLLFPGYVFVQCSPEQRMSIKETKKTWDFYDADGRYSQRYLHAELAGLLTACKKLQYQQTIRLQAGSEVSLPSLGISSAILLENFQSDQRSRVQLKTSLLGGGAVFFVNPDLISPTGSPSC